MAKNAEKNEKSKSLFYSLEEEVLSFWNKSDIFDKSVKKEAPNGDYVFYDGPPFATGLPHYGHIVASIIKDAVPRYWTMRGFRVERKWGWDCHGLPIENIVEKELGSKCKRDIEEIGVEKFNELCRSKVTGYVDDWKRVIAKLGRWADMENDYKTMDLPFMESVWHVFKTIYDKGLVYKGYRSMHICPRCETTLSQSEVTEGYKDIKDLSAIAKFELVDEPNTFVLAWTTTPWTLPGNMALAVGGDLVYVKIKILDGEKKGEIYIVALERSLEILLQLGLYSPDLKDNPLEKEGNILKFDNFEVEKIKGSELVNKRYKPLFSFLKENIESRDDFLRSLKTLKGKQAIKNVFDDSHYKIKSNLKEKAFKIYSANFVNVEDGTGIVHIAPAFGEDDLNLAKQEKFLVMMQHVSFGGNILGDITYCDEDADNLAGLNVKPKENHMATDIEIIKYLAHKNLLFSKKKYEHSYPHCWRCDTPLLNYATSSWFVNVTQIKQKMLENAKPINWSPAHIKNGRWGNWLEGARDWSISRQRYWASVMPIWECDKECGERKVIGSVKELEELSGVRVDDLHKHIVDKVSFPCKCGGTMKRIPDVLDTWFDSGSMPFAQMHYPFENKEKFEENFPAEFIAEGTDQTRCWFYYMHILANGTKDTNAFKNVIVNGIVLAEDGKKMSKKLQNYPDPMSVFERYGADALRYYLLTSPVMLADNLNFSEKGVSDSLRRINMTLWNVLKFFTMFEAESGNKNTEAEKRDSANVLDRWILARLNQLIEEVNRGMESYNLPEASRPIAAFIDDLSTWYIRRSRDRFKGEDEKDKAAGLVTTRFVLLELSKIIAPFTPFIAEQVWQKISGNDFQDKDRSVHLEGWPQLADAGLEEEKIIQEMEAVRKIVELGLAKRDEAGIKVRQPLKELRIANCELRIDYVDLIKDEVNVKNVGFIKCEGDLSVELDIEITEELKLEGMKRELVRFINSLRKEAGLSIGDRVDICYETESKLVENAIEKYITEIKNDTLSDDIKKGINSSDQQKEIKANGEALVLGLIKK